MESILIVKTSAIGDVIHTFPVLEYLREKFPDAQIDWVVETAIAKLLSSHPLLSHVIPVDFKKWRHALFSRTTFQEYRQFLMHLRQKQYDVLFDLQGNSKSALITACAKAKAKVGYGWKCVSEKPNLLVTRLRFNVSMKGNVRNKYLELVQTYYTEEGIAIPSKGMRLRIDRDEKMRLDEILSENVFTRQSCIMVAFGSKWPNKQLEFSTLHSFILEIAKNYTFSFMLIYGNEQEKLTAESLASALPNRARVVGDLTLPLWQALMWHVKAVIAVDSAALHLCATTLTPSFSVFGPSLADVYKPLGEKHQSIQGLCPYEERFSKHCPKLRTCPTGACIKELKVQELFRAFELWMRRVMA